MNRTDAIKAHKLSQGMVDALSRAAFRKHATGTGEAGYVIHDMHPRTRKALHDRGLMYGHYYLTRKGIEVLATLAGNTLDTRGYVWEGDKLLVAPYVDTYADDVTVTDMPSAPEFDAPGAAECFFGCGSDVVAVFVDYVGRTEGLCAGHRDRVEGATYELPIVTPEERQTDAESVSEGSQEEPFVFVPGTHALDMGNNSYNRFCGIGESMGVPGSLYTFGLATAISAHPGMNGTGQNNIPCEFGDVITVRTSLGDKRYVVSDNRYSATGPRKGDPILTPYALDDVRCTRCETHGDNSMVGKNIGGEWVCGFCVENTESDESAREFPCFKRMGVVTHKGECSETRNENGPVCSLENDETDAGFVETDSTDDSEYPRINARGETVWACCESSIGATCGHRSTDYDCSAVANLSTGTTHHTMDAHGGQWERFDHVLSVGDIVRSTETGRALYEVYALIPGLPIVYVDPCDGRAPFPMGATKLYAL